MSVDAAAPADVQPVAQPAAQPGTPTLDDWARAMDRALARGRFTVPESIDAHNVEVAALFLGGPGR